MKRAARRFLFLFALCALLPAGAAAARIADSGSSAKRTLAAVSSLLPNGGFESSTSGWGGYNASLSIVPGGANGSPAAVRVTGSRRATSFSVFPSPKPVAATVAGVSYVGGGYVRSSTSRTLCLKLREWSGSTVTREAQSCVSATSSWQALPAVSLTSLSSGRQLDAYVYSTGASAGSFDADELTLSNGAAPPPTTTTAPPPPPTTTTTTTTTPPPPAPASGCTLNASTGGSDSASGSAAAPFRTVAKLLSALAPGQTGCLASGQTFAETLGNVTAAGAEGARITLTSSDPANPATIAGRIVTKPAAKYLTFSSLILNGANSTGAPSPTVGSDYITFSNVEVTNNHTGICFNLIADATWGTARYTVIDSSRIHDCGRLPSTNLDHGIYVSGLDVRITNNWIWDNADRGVQLRGAQRAIVKNNVIDGNGEGVIFGDLAAAGNEVAFNVIANSKIRWNVESYWGSSATGTGNSLHDNCIWNGAAGNIQSPDGFTATANKLVDPLFVNRALKNFSLLAASPCAGYGPAAPAAVRLLRAGA